MRRLLRILVLLAGLVVLFAVFAAAGYWLPLDHDREYTAAAAALPEASSDSDGLVSVRASGMTFRARVAGLANSGPPVILLHGFPETSIMWEPLTSAVAADGFRVVAFDQRGYSPLARPADTADYDIDLLIADVLAVADAFGFERFHLVGHDWGCVVGWGVTSQQPDRVLSYAAHSIPHPHAFTGQMDAEPPAYVRFFNSPPWPELLFGWGGGVVLRNMIYAGMPAELIDEYAALFAEPGAMTAALNWYRATGANIRRMGAVAGAIQQPVLFVYGSAEMWAQPEIVERQNEMLLGPREIVELDAGHWLMQEQRDATVEATLQHLRRSRDAAAEGSEAAAAPDAEG